MDVDQTEEQAAAAARRAVAIGDQVHEVTQRQQQFERRLARRLRTDAPGLATMQHLVQTGGATPTELARTLGISTAATTLVLDRLAGAGHVSRRPHPTDRRRVVVEPTAASTDVARALVAPLTTGVEALVASLDADEQRVVSAFLDGMLRVYDAVLERDDPAEGPGPC